MDEIRPRFKMPHWGRVVISGENFDRRVCLGNGTQWRITAFFTPRGELFIGIESHGSYRFGHFVHWTYAMEKLGILNGDAMNLSDWINAQLGEALDVEQGRYTENLCEDMVSGGLDGRSA